MKNLVISLVILYHFILSSKPAFAHPDEDKSKIQNSRTKSNAKVTDESVAAKHKIIELEVDPAPAMPQLPYRSLLPTVSELSEGNPHLNYLKCLSTETDFFSYKMQDKRESWLKMKLKDLPNDILKTHQDSILRIADEGARMTTMDWQIRSDLKKDRLNTRLPDIQEIRRIIIALEVRYRAELNANDYPAAIYTLKSIFSMANHYNEHPTTLSSLVGTRFANDGCDRLEEWITQPNSPNLYVALSLLPSPFIHFLKAIDDFTDYRMALPPGIELNKPLSDEEVLDVLSTTEKEMSMVENVLKDRLEQSVLQPKREKMARQELIQHELDPKLVAKMSANQVVLIADSIKQVDRNMDKLKWTALPYWQCNLPETLSKEKPKKEIRFYIFDDGLIHEDYYIKKIQTLLEQRILLLRCIEALRLYASKHNGNLPSKLGDLPAELGRFIDPVTGKDISYSVKNGVAILENTPVFGLKDDPKYHLEYRITIRKPLKK